MSKIYITGISALTSTGHHINDVWSNIISGKTNSPSIKNWDLSKFPITNGYEIADVSASMLPDKKLKKVISKQDIFGIYAAQQAIEHSGIKNYQNQLLNSSAHDAATFADRSGIFVGSPGNKYFQQYDFLPLIAKSNANMQEFAKELFTEVHPMWLLKSLPNNVLAYVGITNNFKGANHNITNHAASGTQAIIEAFHAIKSGQIDRACVVAYDLGTEPQALFYYDKLGLLSNTSLKPFDMEHDGTILAEGASAIMLENEKSVLDRNAKCYAELIGGDTKTEASGLFSIADDGKQLENLLASTLNKYNLNSNNFTFVTAHGNGNPKSDITESIAIKNIFGKNTPTTAFKWSMGHTICASGVLDTSLSVMSLNEKCIPGIANLEKISSNCEEISINKHHRNTSQGAHAMIINRGFAGINACVIIKSCD